MFKLYLLVMVAAISLNLRAQGNVQKQLKPYVVISGPLRLNEARVNIENYTPNSKNISRSEISFGDGSAVSTLKDVYHTYDSNGSFTITVKTWDIANILTTYSEVVDINPAFQIQDIANSSVFNIPKALNGKPEILNITATQASKLYKLTLAKTPVPRVRRTFPACRIGSNVSINGISVFKASEFTCTIGQSQRFVVLSNSNTLQFETSETTAAFNFSIEIHEVKILKDISHPLLSSNVLSNTLTRNSQVHISVADASAVTTYVWNNSQQLLLSTTNKEFDLTLAEGANYFVLQSIDAFNNQSAFLYLSNIRLDTRPPVISAILAPEYIYNVYPQTVTININSDEDLQALTINNVAATLLTPRTFSYLVTVNQPGILNLNIKAFDIAGNESIKAYTPIFSIENTPPVISSSLVTNSFTNQNSLQITVTDDSETTTEVFINSLLVLTTTEKIFNVTLLAGANSILVKSKDSNNNEALSLSLNITYDISPPVLSHNIKAQYFANQFPRIIKIAFQTNEPLKEFLIDNQPATSTALGYEFEKSVLSAGVHQIRVEATDLSNNVFTTTYNIEVVLDILAPLITLTNTPAINFTNLTAFPFTVSIDDQSSVKTDILLNQVLLTTVLEKNFSYSLNLPADGVYNIVLISTDESGNSNAKNLTVTRDTRPLVITILSPQAGSLYTSQLVEVRFTSNKAIKNAFVNNVAVSVSADLTSVTHNSVILNDGLFVIVVRVEDQYGGFAESSVQVELKLAGSSSWSYEECPVE